jgi:hypothetical protein
MDALGVQQAVLTNNCERVDEHVLSSVETRPDRFVLSAYVNPRTGWRPCAHSSRSSRGTRWYWRASPRS